MRGPSYRSLTWTMWVSLVFAGIVATGVVVSTVRLHLDLPLDDPRYLELVGQLDNGVEPVDVAVQERLRALDVTLRREYFEQIRFLRRGAWLLAAGILSAVLCAQWGALIRRQLPTAKPLLGRQDVEVQHNRWAQWGTLALLVGLIAAVVVTRPARQNLVSRRAAQLQELVAEPTGSAAVSAVSAGETAPGESQPVEPAATAAGPTDAEYLANWPRFRGPRGDGVAAFPDVPLEWDATTGAGVLWKTPIPLPGVSSPIVWGDHVFLTGATQQQREVYCVRASSGDLLWTCPVGTAPPEDLEMKVDRSTGFAASTPATDGRRVYAIFASGDLVAIDFTGHVVWSHAFGIPDNPYGHASSLATHGDLLFVQWDQGDPDDAASHLYAFHAATGEMAWEVPREVPSSWSSPIIVEMAGQWRVITCAEPWVIAYAVEDGRELWRAECLQGDIGPSPVYADGVVYVANDTSQAAAIRDGGSGDVTGSHVLWTTESTLPDICSPLIAGKFVLLVASYGVLGAFDRETGGEEPLWEAELDGMLMASPSRVRERLYFVGDDGKGWVATLGDEGLVRVAENNLGEPCSACPAFQPGRIYLRGQDHLYCVGNP